MKAMLARSSSNILTILNVLQANRTSFINQPQLLSLRSFHIQIEELNIIIIVDFHMTLLGYSPDMPIPMNLLKNKDHHHDEEKDKQKDNNCQQEVLSEIQFKRDSLIYLEQHVDILQGSIRQLQTNNQQLYFSIILFLEISLNHYLLTTGFKEDYDWCEGSLILVEFIYDAIFYPKIYIQGDIGIDLADSDLKLDMMIESHGSNDEQIQFATSQVVSKGNGLNLIGFALAITDVLSIADTQLIIIVAVGIVWAF